MFISLYKFFLKNVSRDCIRKNIVVINESACTIVVLTIHLNVYIVAVIFRIHSLTSLLTFVKLNVHLKHRFTTLISHSASQ